MTAAFRAAAPLFTLLGLTIVLCSTAPATKAASFDCAMAEKPLEKLICADQDLSRVDEEMATAYKANLAPYSAETQTKLRQSQRDWLRFIRKYCGYWLTVPKPDASLATDCLKLEYEQRQAELDELTITQAYRFYVIHRYQAVAMLKDSKAGKRGELVRHQSSYYQIDTPSTPEAAQWNEKIARQGEKELLDAGLEKADTADFHTGYRVLSSLPGFISYESFTDYVYRGWGQPRSDSRIHNLILVTGADLKAEDLFNTSTPWQRAVADLAIAPLIADAGREMKPEALAGVIGNADAWEISAEALTVHPDFYLMSGGWRGSGSATIPWRDLKPYLRPDLPIALKLD